MWTIKGKIRARWRLARDYRAIAASGLFDSAFYLKNHPELEAGSSDLLRHYVSARGAEAGDPSPLFDSKWYLDQNPDVKASGANPLVHFIQSGWREGRNPHPLFDVAFYMAQRPQAGESGLNPLLDFLQSGGNEGRNPHPLFDAVRYLKRNPDVAQAGVNPLVHYLEQGWKEGRTPHSLFDGSYYLSQYPELAAEQTNSLIHFVTSGFKAKKNPNPLFDSTYYAERYPDVSSTGSNPLIHYVLSGATELRSPHPLFDPQYYLSQLPERARTDINPLEHYFDSGIKQRLNPHPLFNALFYLAQDRDLFTSSNDPLTHYLAVGAQQGLDPCELFDTSYYLQRHPELAHAGCNPLAHYVTEGAKDGYNPNPLFETAYYLKQYPDVLAMGSNPLVHYLEAGASEGRSPSPFFDSLYYLLKNPLLKELRINPLADYLKNGAEKGRDPNPFFSTARYLREHLELKGSGINPLVHFLGLSNETVSVPEVLPSLPPPSPQVTLRICDLAPAPSERSFGSQRSRLKIICVSHVSPHSPRAGNEYRISRLLRWLRSEGFEITLVLSPLPGLEVASSEVLSLGLEFDGAALCCRDGNVTCSLSDADMRTLSDLDGSPVPDYSERLGENRLLDHKALELLNNDRTFCHDTLIHLVVSFALSKERCVVLAEYIFMSRLLPALRPGTLKIIDTHDVFSSKREKVVAFGVKDSLSLTEGEEAERLARADLVLAIQRDEELVLKRLSGPSTRVITAGVDFPVAFSQSEPSGKQIFFVGSDNSMNAHGLQDFLRFAWPLILKAVPDAELLVAGNVCKSVKIIHSRVSLLGPVEDLSPLYGAASVTVNPALAGTGLKIKTLESLANLRPLVTWPSGIDGLHPDLAAFCHVANDWFEFSLKVTSVLTGPRGMIFTDQARVTIKNLLSPAATYSLLGQELRTFAHVAEVATA